MLLFPKNGLFYSHETWNRMVKKHLTTHGFQWFPEHFAIDVLFPAPGAESIVRFAKEQHRKAGSTSGARASMGSYPQHTPSNI